MPTRKSAEDSVRGGRPRRAVCPSGTGGGDAGANPKYQNLALGNYIRTMSANHRTRGERPHPSLPARGVFVPRGRVTVEKS
jgi:hypothetical protein